MSGSRVGGDCGCGVWMVGDGKGGDDGGQALGGECGDKGSRGGAIGELEEKLCSIGSPQVISAPISIGNCIQMMAKIETHTQTWQRETANALAASRLRTSPPILGRTMDRAVPQRIRALSSFDADRLTVSTLAAIALTGSGVNAAAAVARRCMLTAHAAALGDLSSFGILASTTGCALQCSDTNETRASSEISEDRSRVMRASSCPMLLNAMLCPVPRGSGPLVIASHAESNARRRYVYRPGVERPGVFGPPNRRLDRRRSLNKLDRPLSGRSRGGGGSGKGGEGGSEAGSLSVVDSATTR